MEKVELMDVYAMDRGITRLVSQMCNVNLNPVCHKQYEMLKLDNLTQLYDRGYLSKTICDEVVDNIRQGYRRIADWHIYQHTLELIEELLVEFEATTRTVHSHDVMLECLSQRTEDELIFQEPKTIQMNERTALIADYLASQINRSFSEGFREIGCRPDSYGFLSDDIYNKVAGSLQASERISLT